MWGKIKYCNLGKNLFFVVKLRDTSDWLSITSAQTLSCFFFANHIRHGGKWLRSFVKSSLFLVRWCMLFGAGCQTEIDLCNHAFPLHIESVTNQKLQIIIRPLRWNALFFASVAIAASFDAGFKLNLYL